MSSWSGVNFAPIDTAAYMSAMLVGVEQNLLTWRVDTHTYSTPVSSSPTEMNAILKNKMGGGTNLGSAIDKMVKEKIVTDGMIMITDNENWRGNQPFELIARYRREFNPDFKMVVMSVQPYTSKILDPSDDKSLDIVGMDANAPMVAMNFIAGRM
jgi:hypothetical protein